MSEAKVFDARALVIDDEDATVIEITRPDGATTGISIELRSADSPLAMALIDQFTNKRMSRWQKRQGAGHPLTAQELRSEGIDALVACTKGWSGLGWGSEAEFPFTHDNCRTVYTDSIIIREQVDQAVKDRTGFTKA